MNVFEMVVALVFLTVIGSVINNMIKTHHQKKETSEDSLREADELRDHILTLEDRIRVLERIVTDSSGREDLRRQFRDLER
jgi:type II secretory pathway component PulJ